MTDLGRILIIAGIVLLIAGGAVMLLGRMPNLPFGKLPGDFSWQRGSTRVYFPLASMIILSILLTIIVNVIIRLFR